MRKGNDAQTEAWMGNINHEEKVAKLKNPIKYYLHLAVEKEGALKQKDLRIRLAMKA